MAPPEATRARQLVVVSVQLAIASAVFAAEVSAEPGPSTALLVLDAALGAVSCLALPVLLRHPERGAAVLIGLAAAAPTVTPAAATSVLWLAQRRRLAVAALAGVAAVAAQGVRGLWRPDLGLPQGWWLLVLVLAHAAVVGWGAWVQARRALLDAVADRTRQAERARIAREMHDTLAHRLSLVATLAGALEYNRSADPDRVAEASGSIRSAAHLALEELRAIIGVLRDDRHPSGDGDPDGAVRRPQPTFGDLAALVDEAGQAGSPVALEDGLAPDDHDRLPPTIGRTAYRVVQEALTNARKHAPGAPVEVAVHGRPGGALVVRVVNGPSSGGARPPGVPGAGAGLIGVRERVGSCGGQVRHGATPAGGFAVEASIPWPM